MKNIKASCAVKQRGKKLYPWRKKFASSVLDITSSTTTVLDTTSKRMELELQDILHVAIESNW